MAGNKLLQEVQELEVEALADICQVCAEYHLKFYLRGGSVLGAVKYQDFVPWDDDIDIAFPRKDYQKLISVMPQRFGGKFRFVCYQKTKNTHCYFPRVILEKSYLKEHGLPQNNERGLVLIDIFPLDGMPDRRICFQVHVVQAYIYRILAGVWTLDAKKTISRHTDQQQMILKLLHAAQIQRLYKQDDIYHKLDRLYAKYEFGKTRKAGMLMSSKGLKDVCPTSWWGKGKKASFHGLEVRIPSQSDLYLKQLFGDHYATTEPDFKDREKSRLVSAAEDQHTKPNWI